MLGIGLIGLGKHGSRYARHIVEDLTEAALVAVCRRNHTEGETFAAAYPDFTEELPRKLLPTRA